MSEIKYKSVPLEEAVGMMLAHDMMSGPSMRFCECDAMANSQMRKHYNRFIIS